MDTSPHYPWLNFSLAHHCQYPLASLLLFFSSPSSNPGAPAVLFRLGFRVCVFRSAVYQMFCMSLRARAGDLEEEERGAAAELAAIAGAAPPPKLEDFLGGGINGGGAGPVSVAETAAAEMYDSDLKFIAAAGFLQSGAVGAAAPSPVSSCSLDQADPKLGLPAAAVPAPEQRKAVDSFGQRTSIYRGVTR